MDIHGYSNHFNIAILHCELTPTPISDMTYFVFESDPFIAPLNWLANDQCGPISYSVTLADGSRPYFLIKDSGYIFFVDHLEPIGTFMVTLTGEAYSTTGLLVSRSETFILDVPLC